MPIRMGAANPARSANRAESDARFLADEVARQVYDRLIASMERQNELRRTGWESANLANVQTVSTQATTMEELRVLFVYAYCTSVSTLQLGSVVLTLPIGANILPLGDDKYGGIVLTPRDVRSLTTTGGAGIMSLLLTGEIIEHTGRN